MLRVLFSGREEEAFVLGFSSFFPSLLASRSMDEGSVSDPSTPKFIFSQPTKNIYMIRNNNLKIK
jgi:hypothetical protein